MGSAAEHDTHMAGRALLTDREKEVLRGEVDDVQDIEAYQQKILSRVKRRADQLETDLEILDDASPEVADLVRERVCGTPTGRLERLEQQVEILQSELEGGDK